MRGIQPDKSPSSAPAEFQTTRWSMIVAAVDADSPASRRALADLCQAYWYPLYAYVRRRGYARAEAQDLTQAFFAELLEKHRLQSADQQRGKFRSFLLASLNHFLANQWRDAHRIKRGGQQGIVSLEALSLDFAEGESRYQWEPADLETPERIFQRRWIMTLLEATLGRLHAEYTQAGKGELFERLKVFMGAPPDAESGRSSYRQIAADLEMTVGAVRTAAHRLRARGRELLREEIAQTVASPEDVDAELQELFSAMG